MGEHSSIKHNTFMWNTLICAYLLARNPAESLRLFRQMSIISGSTATADSHAFSVSLQACGGEEHLITGSSIHAHAVKLGFCSDLFVQTALVGMYAKTVNFGIARHVFDEIPEKDLVVHNAMLADDVNRGDILEARQLYDAMPEKDLISWNTIFHGYAMISDVGAARDLFNRMKERDLVSWSSLIYAYVHCRKFKWH